MKNNMSNPQTANNDAKQSFFVRLSAKIKSLIKANKVEKTNTKAVHARNRAESKILIKAKPVLMAIKWMFKIACIGFFGTLAYHSVAYLIANGTEFLAQLVFWRLFVVALIAGATVFGIRYYQKQKRKHLHKYTKRASNSEHAKYMDHKPELHALSVMALIVFVPYIVSAIADFVWVAFQEAAYVAEMVFVNPIGICLMVITVVKAAHGLYKEQVKEWDRIAAKNAPKR